MYEYTTNGASVEDAWDGRPGWWHAVCTGPEDEMLVLRMQVSNFTLRGTSSPNLIRRSGFGKPIPIQFTTELMYNKVHSIYTIGC